MPSFLTQVGWLLFFLADAVQHFWYNSWLLAPSFVTGELPFPSQLPANSWLRGSSFARLRPCVLRQLWTTAAFGAPSGRAWGPAEAGPL